MEVHVEIAPLAGQEEVMTTKTKTTKKTTAKKAAEKVEAKADEAKANGKVKSAKPRLKPTNQKNADPKAPWPKCGVCGGKDAKGILFLTVKNKKTEEEKQTTLPIHGEKKRGKGGKVEYARPCVDVATSVTGDDFGVVSHRVVKSPRLSEELEAKAKEREEKNRAEFTKTMKKMFGEQDTSNNAMAAAMGKAQAEKADAQSS